MEHLFPYLISVAMSFVSGMSLYITKKLYDKNVELREQRKEANIKRERATQKLILATARRDLKDEMMDHLNRGYVTTAEYEEIEETFKAYIECGGNGTVHHLHDERWSKLKIMNEKD